MKAKVVISEWCDSLALYLPDDTVYDCRENDYMVTVCADNELDKYIQEKLAGIDLDFLPFASEYYSYSKIDNEYEIDVTAEQIAKALNGKLGIDILINPSKTDMALFMAINKGYVLNDDGEPVEPDASDSPLRKAGLI